MIINNLYNRVNSKLYVSLIEGNSSTLHVKPELKESIALKKGIKLVYQEVWPIVPCF